MVKDGQMPRSPELTDGVRNEVVRLYQLGTPTSQITQETGVGRGTLYWILQQAGVKTDRARPDAGSDHVAQLQRQLLDLHLQIGRLMGRLEALESRLDRADRREG